MTNGGSPGHGLKRPKKAPDKKNKGKGMKTALKRKNLIPAALDKGKQA